MDAILSTSLRKVKPFERYAPGQLRSFPRHVAT